MDSRSEDGAEHDRGSVCSTAATGLSTLSSRIASLATDFGDRLRPGIAEVDEYGAYAGETGDDEEEEEEEIVELTEEQVLQELDKQEPAFQVKSRAPACESEAPSRLASIVRWCTPLSVLGADLRYHVNLFRISHCKKYAGTLDAAPRRALVATSRIWLFGGDARHAPYLSSKALALCSCRSAPGCFAPSTAICQS